MTDEAPYMDAGLSVGERVEDLLSRMSIEEKAGQLCQIDAHRGWEEWVGDKLAGSFLNLLGEETIEAQKRAERSRLGIPLLFGIDAIHGHAFWPGATVFPTQLGMSSSWNPEMIERVGRITARETRATGAHWTFSPVCGTVRDLRWGRVDETFGEDPYLIGQLAAALVRGYQGDGLTDADAVLACGKHYAGYSETRGGRDASEADLTRRKLLSVFLAPFKAVCDAGCATLMTAYEAIDGVPCTANRWLLTEVLRERWGFEGVVVTDYDNVGRMHEEQKTCETFTEASARAVEAGNDLMMHTPAFYEGVLEAVEGGRLSEDLIDRACRRILRLKFAMGLFDENRHPDLSGADEVIGCEEHKGYALEVARESIVLLKNEGDLLPLPDNLGRVAVIGPNADDTDAQLGDWSLGGGHSHKGRAEHPRENIVTALDGIRERLAGRCEVAYCAGCGRRDEPANAIEEAVRIAADADVAICVLGDDTSLNGEGRDRATLKLTGAQQELLMAVYETGTPVALVIISGKPLSIEWAAQRVPAVLAAWNPGMQGGRAIAEVLFGDVNPCGKLSVSWPRHVGQQPVYYNQVPGWHAESYADMDAEPLWPFGHGLSYTTFEYSELSLLADRLRADETLSVSIQVENTGDRAGTEIVQLYVNDLYSSVTTPRKELKAFARVDLEPGEKRRVSLEVPCARLALVSADLEWVVEPGRFELMVGPSSRDEDLLRAQFEVVE